MCQASTLRTWPWIQMRAWKSYGMRYVFILYISMDNYVLFPSSRPCIVIHLMLVLLWMVILHWKLQSEVLLKVFRLVFKDNFAFFFYFILFFVFSTFSFKKVDARRGFLCWIRFNKVCPWYKQWFFFFHWNRRWRCIKQRQLHHCGNCIFNLMIVPHSDNLYNAA